MRNNIPFTWDVMVLQREDGTRAFLSYGDYLCAIAYSDTDELWVGTFRGLDDNKKIIKAPTLTKLARMFKAAILAAKTFRARQYGKEAMQ